MPQVIITAAARAGLNRCRIFLMIRNPAASKRASAVISRSFALLETSPDIGRPSSRYSELRELLIPFGDSGYMALYAFDHDTDKLLIMAFRHQKETNY